MIVDQSAIREYLALNESDATSKYSAGTVGSNSRAAQQFIERRTGRILESVTKTMTFSTDGRSVIPLPGLRTATSVQWNGVTLTANVDYWLLPDSQQSSVYTGIQLRPYDTQGGPWYKAIPTWWDRGLDNPYRPGGFNPNDLVIVGDWGYASNDTMPFPLILAIKVLAAFYTVRPNSLLGNVSISPDGFATTYGDVPPEVAAAITEYRISESVVSIGGN